VLFVMVGLSAGVGSAVTFVATRGDRQAAPSAAAPTPTSALPRAEFSATEAAAAKKNLCQVFDISVRGQEGQGGFRVEGKLNVPVTLRALNGATAVQTALSPAVPMEVAAAARQYISATLDVTTAAMGNTPTNEVNRLTDLDAEAIYALLDVCGLPR